MDIPLIRRFALGYEEGEVRQREDRDLPDMTGTTPAALERPDTRRPSWRGASRPRRRRHYAAAAPTGSACSGGQDKGRLAIGVDSNQNHIHPGSVLTSMIKRVDLAVYEAFKAAKDGRGRRACALWASPRVGSVSRSTSTIGV